jgi:hypothetical protein
MRFLSVDPLAADYAAWSGYNYVLENPLVFVDPDGRSVDDIIIGKSKSNANYKAEVFTIHTKSESGEKSVGTDLIRSFIEGERSDKTVTITDHKDAPLNNALTTAISPADARNPSIGSDSKIIIRTDFKAQVRMKDGMRADIGLGLTLGHELGHAANNADGTSLRGVDRLQEEENTVKKYENPIREENKQPLREDDIKKD